MSEVGLIFYLLRPFSPNHRSFCLARRQSLCRWWRQANDRILHRDDSASYLRPIFNFMDDLPVESFIL